MFAPWGSTRTVESGPFPDVNDHSGLLSVSCDALIEVPELKRAIWPGSSVSESANADPDRIVMLVPESNNVRSQSFSPATSQQRLNQSFQVGIPSFGCSPCSRENCADGLAGSRAPSTSAPFAGSVLPPPDMSMLHPSL